MSDTLELVQFKLNSGATEAAFLAANAQVDQWVRRQPGFRYRSLSCDDQGIWNDVVYWASAQDAKAASDNFMAELCKSDFMAMIDETSVRMNHSRVVHSAMAESCGA